MLAISVIIVTYNSELVIESCLESIRNQDFGRKLEIIVIDNASQDSSVDLCVNAGAMLIANGANAGFGHACNQGARAAKGELLLFLNPDASLKPGALQALAAAARNYPGAAAFGPHLSEPDGGVTFQSETFIEAQRGRRPQTSLTPEGDCCVGFLSGAALMVRRGAFEKVGGFDENIFLYYEDDDLCHRLREAGHALVYTPGAQAIHCKGTSCQRTLAGDYARGLHMARSRIYVCGKYGLPLQADMHIRRSAIRASRAMLGLNARKAARHLSLLRAYAGAWLR